jgi:hypothetical protein
VNGSNGGVKAQSTFTTPVARAIKVTVDKTPGRDSAVSPKTSMLVWANATLVARTPSSVAGSGSSIQPAPSSVCDRAPLSTSAPLYLSLPKMV